MTKSKLILIGAGPGDPDLITIKAVKALSKAPVVLYDALVNRELLEYTPKNCIKISVGKRYKQHLFPQDHINKMIVKYALQYGTVVRLKGGDPCVFGRGYEEMEYATQHGIACEIIPGISSALAVPSVNGLPLTVRGVAESFWVVTGTTKSGEISGDLYNAIHSTATVVILMGMNKLFLITDMFISAGKGNIPAAIVQDGTLPTEKVAIGTADQLVQLADQHQLTSPAVIIIGEALSHRQELKKGTGEAVNGMVLKHIKV